jgi:hypothetical protein
MKRENTAGSRRRSSGGAHLVRCASFYVCLVLIDTFHFLRLCALVQVAGDVSDSIDVLRATLAVLKSTFGAGVAFVPGNHDLWCSLNSGGNSLDKLAEVLRVCT